MKILVIDNYDSFTYNLIQIVECLVEDVVVKKNDEIDIEEITKIDPDKILISPGPGRPEDSNITIKCIQLLGSRIPILGVCLGHQAIGYCFGAKIIQAPILMHGKVSNIIHDGKTIFKDIPQFFLGGRYHSLIIERESLANLFEISAYTSDRIIMGIRHKIFPLEGIQFHPESIMTNEGAKIIKNWINL